MKRCILLCLFSVSAFAQNYGYFAGSRSTAMAHSSVALVDVWSTHHNQAAMAFLEKPVLGFSYQNKYFLSDLANANFALAIPNSLGTWGLSLNYFGFNLYSHSKIGFSYARAFGDYLSFGTQFNLLHQYVDKGTNNGIYANGEFGLLIKPTKQLSLACHIYNPTARYSSNEHRINELLILRIGGFYSFNSDFFISGQIQKQIDEKEQYSIGTEYKFLEF